jgi:hypothetical protein
MKVPLLQYFQQLVFSAERWRMAVQLVFSAPSVFPDKF